MTKLKRYNVGDTAADEEGEYVIYADAMEAIRQARAEALEEAARFIEGCRRYVWNEKTEGWYAEQIRALKSEPITEPQEE